MLCNINHHRLISQTGGAADLYFSYDANGTLVSLRRNSTMYYYMRNAQNDIIGLVNEAGSVLTAVASPYPLPTMRRKCNLSTHSMAKFVHVSRVLPRYGELKTRHYDPKIDNQIIKLGYTIFFEKNH